jgi:hypothetical protein
VGCFAATTLGITERSAFDIVNKVVGKDCGLKHKDWCRNRFQIHHTRRCEKP